MMWQRRTTPGTMGADGLDLVGRGVAVGAAVLLAAPLVVATLLAVLVQ